MNYLFHAILRSQHDSKFKPIAVNAFYCIQYIMFTIVTLMPLLNNLIIHKKMKNWKT